VASYPAIHDPGIIEKLLEVIESRDPPKVVTVGFLESSGLRRETDEQLMLLLEFLGYIDEQHQPTNIWLESRDRSRAPGLLGSSIKASYWKLFDQYPDAAETTDGTTLMSFFREHSDADERTAAYMILTFKVLCDLADFQAAEEEAPQPRAEEPVKEKKEEKLPPPPPKVEETQPEETPPAVSDEGSRVILQLEVDVSKDPELAELVRKLLRRRLE